MKKILLILLLFCLLAPFASAQKKIVSAPTKTTKATATTTTVAKAKTPVKSAAKKKAVAAKKTAPRAAVAPKKEWYDDMGGEEDAVDTIAAAYVDDYEAPIYMSTDEFCEAVADMVDYNLATGMPADLLSFSRSEHFGSEYIDITVKCYEGPIQTTKQLTRRAEKLDDDKVQETVADIFKVIVATNKKKDTYDREQAAKAELQAKRAKSVKDFDSNFRSYMKVQEKQANAARDEYEKLRDEVLAKSKRAARKDLDKVLATCRNYESVLNTVNLNYYNAQQALVKLAADEARTSMPEVAKFEVTNYGDIPYMPMLDGNQPDYQTFFRQHDEHFEKMRTEHLRRLDDYSYRVNSFTK